jgi:hypothetical protein
MRNEIKIAFLVLTIPLTILLVKGARYHHDDNIFLPNPIPDGLFVKEAVTDIDLPGYPEYSDIGPDAIKLSLGEDDSGNPVDIKISDKGDEIKFFFVRDIGGKYRTNGHQYKKKSEIWPYIQSRLIFVYDAELEDFSDNVARITLKAIPSDISTVNIILLLILIVTDSVVISKMLFGRIRREQ